MDLKVIVFKPKQLQKLDSRLNFIIRTPRTRTHKQPGSAPFSNISTNTSSQQLSLNVQIGPGPSIFEYEETPLSIKNPYLSPLSSNQVRRERSIIINKNQTLQSLIDKFLEKKPEIKLQNLNHNSIDLGKTTDTSELDQSIEQFCKDEIKAYRFNLKKNLKIEKIRISNYRRYRMRSMFMANL